MNRRIVTAAVTGAVAVGLIGTAFALPSQARTRSGAFSFVAEQTSNRNFKNGNSVSSDNDVSNGHVIGTDSLACTPAGAKSATCEVAASYKGGQLYGTFTLSFKDGSLAGKVTGGTRQFKDATGTLKGHSVGNNKEKVSVTYQTP